MTAFPARVLVSCVLALGLSACSGDDAPQSSNAGASGSGGKGSAGSSGTTSSAGGAAGSGGTSSSGGSGGGVPTTPGKLGGCDMFPADDAWNTDVSGVAVDATWTARLQSYVGDIDIHPDWGSDGDYLYGLPINIVPADQPGVTVTFDGADEESDHDDYPFPGPDTVKIEGWAPTACDSDCHLLAVQQGSCTLFEAFACQYQDGWTCYSGAIFDLALNSYGQRTLGWTSADAAGLAITPGLVRYDEVRAGEVPHAIRFTLDCTTNKYVRPASHYAVPGGCDPADRPPMGMRVRLGPSIDPEEYPEGTRTILIAMKKYGMILADNGSNFYFQGEAHPDWLEEDIEPLKAIPASAFEVLEMPPLEP